MNPNIALSFQRPRFDPGEGQRNALAMRNAQMQEAANLMTMQNSMEDRQFKTQQRNALSGVDFSQPEGMQQAANVSAQYGDIDTAMKIQQHIASLPEQKQKAAIASFDMFNRVAPLLTDPNTYPQGRQALMEFGAPIPLPEEWTPEFGERVRGMALGIKGLEESSRAERATQASEAGKTVPLSPEVAAQQLAKSAAGAAQTSVVSYGDRKADQLDAQYFHDLYANIQGEGRASEKLAMDYKLIDQLIGGAYSGAGANQVQSVKKLGRILGLDLGDVSGPEAAAVVANQLALKLRSPEGGAGMPGAMSDKDREFLIAMVPGLATTKEGRQLMSEVQKRIAKRNQEVAKLARDYRLQNKYLDINFEQAVSDRFSGQDIFADLQGKVPADAAPAGPVQISSDADYNALPSGAEFLAPDGTVRVKP